MAGESLQNGGERFFDANNGLRKLKNGAIEVRVYKEPDGTKKIRLENEDGGGVIESVAVLGGNFVTSRVDNAGGNQGYNYGDKYRYFGIWKYAYSDYSMHNAFSEYMQSNNPDLITMVDTGITTGSTTISGNVYLNTSKAFDKGWAISEGFKGITSDSSVPGYSATTKSVVVGSGGKITHFNRLNETSTGSKSGFIRMANNIGGSDGNQSATMLNNGNIMYARNFKVEINTETHQDNKGNTYSTPIRELVHLDTHGAADIVADQAKLMNALNKMLQMLILNF